MCCQGKFSANVAQRAGFRCPLGAGLVDFKNSDDFGCFALLASISHESSRPSLVCRVVVNILTILRSL